MAKLISRVNHPIMITYNNEKLLVSPKQTLFIEDIKLLDKNFPKDKITLIKDE